MDFQELTDNYKKRTDDLFRQIEANCVHRKRKGITNFSTPSFVEDVIIPIYVSLAECMRRKGLKIPNPKTYLPIKGYYRIKIGLITVGGFSVPENGDYRIYFTPMKSAKPIGPKQLVSNTEELKQLINNQLKTKQQVIK